MVEHEHAWEYFANPQGQWARRCLVAGCSRVEVAQNDLNRDWQTRAKTLEQQLAEAIALLQRGNMLISDVLHETDDAHLSRVDPKALSGWQRAYAAFVAQHKP